MLFPVIFRPRDAARVSCEISTGRMPFCPAKVYRAEQGSGQRNHAKAGLLFPPGGHFRMSGLSEITRQSDMLRTSAL
jgi:hypothetical protein